MAILAFQSLSAQPYNFINYSVEEGLPQSQVQTVLSDSRGYLWLGTPGGGLSRFDGQNFEIFSIEDSLPSNNIQTLFEDADGQVWIGTTEGLAYFDGRIFHSIPSPSDKPLFVTAIARQTDSSLWVGTKQGIYQYLRPQKQLEKAKLNVLLDQLSIQNFFTGENGLWIATTRGAWHLGDALSHFDRQNGLTGEDIRAFTRAADGQLWILTHNHGINTFDEKSMQVTGSRQPPAMVRALCAFTDMQQQLWVGTQDRGIFIYSPSENRWRQMTENNGLPNNHIQTILSDQWDNTWIGSAGGGLSKYLGQFFTHFNRRNGLPDDRIYALAKDHQNQLWISAGNRGITLYDEQTGLRPMEKDSGLINVPVKTMMEDTQSRMWVGTDGLGLLLFDSTDLRRFSQLEGLPSNWIRKLAEDSLGQIWVATRANGMALIRSVDQNGLIIDRIGLEEGLEERNISTLEVDAKGRVWFATRTGSLGYFENRRLSRLYKNEDGLPGVEIRSIAFDHYERIWLGTAGSGIFYANTLSEHVQFRPLQSNTHGLTSLNINLLIFDTNGHLWAGHERGIDKIKFSPAGMVEEIQHFGRNEGFLGQETYPGAALIDRAGNLWFGTTRGLIKHRPADRSLDISTPLIHLRSISLFYQPLEATPYAPWAKPGGIRPGLLLPHHQNRLRFTFKGINLSDPKDVQYRWRLLGSEESWSPLSKSESESYSYLPPGEYTFEVQACSGVNNCSNSVSATFQIKKPFWQLLWFQLAGVFVILALLWAIFRWRIRTIRRREKAKREKLEVQNHLLQLEQKALQLQMNPHFIFNALNSIQSLVSTQDFRTARQEINHFASLMRTILSNSRKQKISLREEINTLEKYLRMEQFCQRVDFTYAIHPPTDIDPEEIEMPPMLIQPFVENAVIHGISHLSGEGKIEIRFSLTEEILTCEIIDNGVGRKRSAELRQSKSPGHQSTAMQVNRERLETLLAGQPLKALEIIDLVEPDGRAAGTRVILRIPVELSF